MNIINRALLAVAVLLAFAASGTASAQPADARWVGVIAVRESPLVNQVIRDSGNNPAIYGMQLRAMLDTGQVQPATGRYCLIPYNGGAPTDSPECFRTRTGVYTMWAPGSYVQQGKAMCVQVPADWPAIVGQLRYPANGGYHVNCYDFGPAANSPNYASTRETAAMVIVIAPAN